MDPARDCTRIEHPPIDDLDVASPVWGPGSRIGLDATHKMEGETTRDWGAKLDMEAETNKRVGEMWGALGL